MLAKGLAHFAFFSKSVVIPMKIKEAKAILGKSLVNDSPDIDQRK